MVLFYATLAHNNTILGMLCATLTHVNTGLGLLCATHYNSPGDGVCHFNMLQHFNPLEQSYWVSCATLTQF
jgi:hypothetical protein